jgi:hypothetical protein
MVAVLGNIRSRRPPYGRRPSSLGWLYFAVYVTVLLSIFAVSTCHADTTCVGQLSLWTPVEHTKETHQWIQPAARAEVSCNPLPSVKLFGRGDLYSIPGSSQPGVESVGAYEGWLGTSFVLYRTVAVAAFGGLHGSFANGALQGGVSRSLCGGIRIDTATDFTVGGLCDAYKPLGPGTAFVFTNVVTVKGAVGVATNLAYIPSTGQRLFAAGPTVSWR